MLNPQTKAESSFAVHVKCLDISFVFVFVFLYYATVSEPSQSIEVEWISKFPTRRWYSLNFSMVLFHTIWSFQTKHTYDGRKVESNNLQFNMSATNRNSDNVKKFAWVKMYILRDSNIYHICNTILYMYMYKTFCIIRNHKNILVS